MAATYLLSINKIQASSTTVSSSVSSTVGSNRVYIGIVNVYGTSATPNLTSLVRGAKTFTEATALRQNPSSVTGADYPYRKTYVLYLLEADVVSGSQTVTATFDGTFELAFMSIFQLSNAYQGAPVDYKYYSDIGVSGLVGASITTLDTQTDSIMVGTMAGFKNASGGNGISWTNKTNWTTRASSVDSVSSHWVGHETITDSPPDAGSHTQSVTWEEIGTSSDIDIDYIWITVEIQDENWTPSDPGVNPDNFCAYVSQGQVRKMINTVTGLDHLEGETIKVQMDGDVPRNASGKEQTNAFTVSNGSITLPKKAAVIHAGLGYDGTIKMLKPNNGSQLGTAQTKMRRIYASALRLYRTLGLSVGIDDDHLDELFQTTQTIPFSGDYDKLPNTTWRKDTEFVIKQTKPAPAYVLAAILRSETEEKL